MEKSSIPFSLCGEPICNGILIPVLKKRTSNYNASSTLMNHSYWFIWKKAYIWSKLCFQSVDRQRKWGRTLFHDGTTDSKPEALTSGSTIGHIRLPIPSTAYQTYLNLLFSQLQNKQTPKTPLFIFWSTYIYFRKKKLNIFHRIQVQ